MAVLSVCIHLSIVNGKLDKCVYFSLFSWNVQLHFILLETVFAQLSILGKYLHENYCRNRLQRVHLLASDT